MIALIVIVFFHYQPVENIQKNVSGASIPTEDVQLNKYVKSKSAVPCDLND